MAQERIGNAADARPAGCVGVALARHGPEDVVAGRRRAKRRGPRRANWPRRGSPAARKGQAPAAGTSSRERSLGEMSATRTSWTTDLRSLPCEHRARCAGRGERRRRGLIPTRKWERRTPHGGKACPRPAILAATVRHGATGAAIRQSERLQGINLKDCKIDMPVVEDQRGLEWPRADRTAAQIWMKGPDRTETGPAHGRRVGGWVSRRRHSRYHSPPSPAPGSCGMATPETIALFAQVLRDPGATGGPA